MPKETAPPPWTCVWKEFGELVELPGGGRLPSRAVAVYVEEGGPEVELEMELEVNSLGITRMSVSPREGPTISRQALARMDLNQTAERVLLFAAWAAQSGLQPGVGAGVVPSALRTPDPDEATAIERVALGSYRRRSITDSLLREVAEIATSNPKRPTSAVSEQMFTSKRNATRWIAEARSKKLLDQGGR